MLHFPNTPVQLQYPIPDTRYYTRRYLHTILQYKYPIRGHIYHIIGGKQGLEVAGVILTLGVFPDGDAPQLSSGLAILEGMRTLMSDEVKAQGSSSTKSLYSCSKSFRASVHHNPELSALSEPNPFELFLKRSITLAAMSLRLIRSAAVASRFTTRLTCFATRPTRFVSSVSNIYIPPPPTSHHHHTPLESAQGSIIYTETDEAPALATYSLLPVISKV